MQLTELKWTEVSKLSRDMPLVFPIAAVEQHGPHMPVFTDSLLLGEVVRRASQSLHGRALFAPLLWLGNSHHHLDFPGTISASPRTYLDTLNDLAESFVPHGFRRFVYLNGHGGNIVPSQQATFELRQKYRSRSDLLLLSVSYWNTGNPNDADASFRQTEMAHACEWETSMMLRLRPELVGDYAVVAGVDSGRGFAPANRAWTTPDRTAFGHIGYPSAASAEKGEALFRVFAAGVAALLERVIAWDGKEWDA